MISVLNFKSYEKGALRGFFDLRYFGLSIKGCRLMQGNNGMWFAFPQVKGEADGEVKYYDQMFLTPLERDHVTRLVLLDLEGQGFLGVDQVQDSTSRPNPIQAKGSKGRGPGKYVARPKEDISDYMPGGGDDIPF
jgi:DNA-binding cell septation regulator SpoVG